MPKTNSKPVKRVATSAHSKSIVRPVMQIFSIRNAKRCGILLVVALAVIGAVILNFPQTEDLTKVSVAIPRSSYPIPNDALYVGPKGNDSASGTLTAPIKTLKSAISRAASGATIILMEGIYREDAGTITTPLTIQAYPGAKVWLDGSDEVTGWVKDGTVWRKDGWTTSANSINPLSFLPDMVFVDGVEQTQVRTLTEVKENTFYVDQAASIMYLGSSPTGRLVEASTRHMALQYSGAGAAGSKLRGIGVRRYASKLTSPHEVGAIEVRDGAKGIRFDKLLFTEQAANGLLLTGSASDLSIGLTITDSVFAGNGASGISGDYTNGLVMQGNTVINNNVQRAQWEEVNGSFAGTKFSRMTNSTIKNNLFQDNHGTGFWCDLDCKDNTIIGNMSRGNLTDGIYYGVGYRAIIASNVTYNNGQAGIKASGQSIKIFNNTSYNNNSENIFVYDDPGLERISSADVHIKNNIVAGGPRSITNQQLIRVSMGRTDIGQTVKTFDNNLYFRSSATQPLNILTWQSGKTSDYFTSLNTTLRNKIAGESKGIAVDGRAIETIFKDATNGDFRLQADAAAVGAGGVLPADVATALDLPIGSKVNIGALSWRAGSSNRLASSSPTDTPPSPTADPKPNAAPTTSVTLNGEVFTAPASFQVTATAADADGQVTKLEILQNGEPVHFCNNATLCRYQVNGYEPTEVYYSSRATDNARPAAVTSSSAAQKVTVAAPAPVALAAPSGFTPTFSQSWFDFRPGLSWPAVPGATGYTVNRAGTTKITTVTKNSYFDTEAATLGNYYIYNVTAFNATQKSPVASTTITLSCGFWVFNCKATIVGH